MRIVEELKPKIKLMSKAPELIQGSHDEIFGIKDPVLRKIQGEFRNRPGTNYVYPDQDKEYIRNIISLCEKFLKSKKELTRKNKKELRAMLQEHILAFSESEKKEIERHRTALRDKSLKNLVKELHGKMKDNDLFLHRFRLLASKELWKVDKKTLKALKRAEAVEKVKKIIYMPYVFGIHDLMGAVSQYYSTYGSKVPKLDELLEKFPKSLQTDYKAYRKKKGAVKRTFKRLRPLR